MDPLLTPTTALLYSILEPSIFLTPTASQSPAVNEPDIFSSAFGEHNLLKNDVLGRQSGLNCSSKDSDWEATRCYISPPGSNDLNSQGTRDSSAENEQMHFCLFPLHAPMPERFPTSRDEGELLAGVPGDHAAGKIFHVNNATALPETHQIRKTRNRKRRPLNLEEKALKHAQFLERNRIAADHCRKRKKVKNAGLEEQCRVLGLRNSILRDMKEDLIAEIRELKDRIAAGGQERKDEQDYVMEEHADEETLEEDHDWALLTKPADPQS